MAGRNLFSTEPVKGRNLFAVTEQQKAVEGAEVTRFDTQSPVVEPVTAEPDQNQQFIQQTVGDLGTDTQGILQKSKELRRQKDIASADLPESEPGINLKGLPEAALTVASGAVAEPVAGIAGIAGTLLPGKEGQGAEFVEKTREALTIQPESEVGKETLQKIGGALEPIAKLTEKIESGIGDTVFEVTGSPALAALSRTLPTAIIEAIGLKKSLISSAKQIKNIRATGKIAKEIKTAVPEIDQLKSTARAVYGEIDESGAVVKPNAFTGLSKKIDAQTKKAGRHPRITPKAEAAVEEIRKFEGRAVKVTEVDTLRKIAQNAADSLERPEKALGNMIISNIDDFLDKGINNIVTPKGRQAVDVAKKYKVARNLWGRARKSELVEKAMENARLAASGNENGIRNEFRKIMRSDKLKKFFSKSELDIMDKVQAGDMKGNIAVMLGKFGFMDSNGPKALMPLLGIGAGGAAGGGLGAILMPMIGQVSKAFAERLTKGRAAFADEVIRAGKDAKKITESYLRNTAPDLRDPSELSQLLMRPDIDLKTLPKSDLTEQVAQLTTQTRAKILAAVAAPSVSESTQEEPQQ